MVDSPSGRVPAKAPRWDLMNTEGYDGGNCVAWCPRMFSGSVGIYRRKRYVGGRPRGPRDRGRALQGGGPPISWGPRSFLDLHSRLDRIRFVPKITLPKVSFRLDSV